MADTIRKKLIDQLIADLTALQSATGSMLNGVKRLTQTGLPDTLNDGDAFVLLDDPEIIADSPAGHQDVRQPVAIACVVALSESSATPIEERADLFCAEVEQQILSAFASGGDNLTYAYDCDLKPRENFAAHPDCKGAWVNVDLFFRHRHGNPFQQ